MGGKKDERGSWKVRALKATLKHGGLLLLVGAYCVGGVYAFQYFEADGEKQRAEEGVVAQRNLDAVRNELTTTLGNALSDETTTDAEYEQLVDDQFEAYYDTLISAHGTTGYPPNGVPGSGNYTIDEGVLKWNFPSALLFTVSVVSTVGYGHVVPVTKNGQIFCIFYALFGIPIMLIFLANIGEIMAKVFRLVYGRVCCYICFKKRRENYDYNRRRVLQARGEAPRSRSAWKNAGGGGRKRKSSPEKKRNEDDVDDEFLRTVDPDSIPHPDDEVVNVPITLTLVVIATYVFLGAVIFSAWEKWSWTQGAYFSFVTLSTIGFGDLVPGWKSQVAGDATAGTLKLIASTVYIVFGLAVLSMSFNLMMEEMMQKFKWLGAKLGIVDTPSKQKGEDRDRSPSRRRSSLSGGGSDDDDKRH